jgi:hypothetical protein
MAQPSCRNSHIDDCDGRNHDCKNDNRNGNSSNCVSRIQQHWTSATASSLTMKQRERGAQKVCGSEPVFATNIERSDLTLGQQQSIVHEVCQSNILSDGINTMSQHVPSTFKCFCTV